MGLTAEEIKQRRPFRSAGHEATVSLLLTADLVRRGVARVVEPAGITLQQFNVLRILRGAGAEGVPTLEIAGRMIEQAPGITRLMDRLEAKGLVRRQRCPTDRRQVLCWITPPGLRLVASLDKPLAERDEAFLRALGRERAARFIGLLDAVRAAHRSGGDRSARSRTAKSPAVARRGGPRQTKPSRRRRE